MRHIEAFAELPEEQLRWFAASAIERRFEPGENVFRKGEPAEWMVVYLEGEIHSRPDDSTLDSYVYIARAGDLRTEVSGRLPFSRMKEWGDGTRRRADENAALSYRAFPRTFATDAAPRRASGRIDERPRA